MQLHTFARLTSRSYENGAYCSAGGGGAEWHSKKFDPLVCLHSGNLLEQQHHLRLLAANQSEAVRVS